MFTYIRLMPHCIYIKYYVGVPDVLRTEWACASKVILLDVIWGLLLSSYTLCNCSPGETEAFFSGSYPTLIVILVCIQKSPVNYHSTYFSESRPSWVALAWALPPFRTSFNLSRFDMHMLSLSSAILTIRWAQTHVTRTASAYVQYNLRVKSSFLFLLSH